MQKGFTLIELLVVIAIIGLLATIALASLNSARTKSADATVKANMANMLAEAEIYYDGVGNNSYGAGVATCAAGVFTDTIISNQLLQAINAAAGGASKNCSTNALGSSWSAIVGPLRGGGYWCVDNVGNKKPEPAATSFIVGGGACL